MAAAAALRSVPPPQSSLPSFRLTTIFVLLLLSAPSIRSSSSLPEQGSTEHAVVLPITISDEIIIFPSKEDRKLQQDDTTASRTYEYSYRLYTRLTQEYPDVESAAEFVQSQAQSALEGEFRTETQSGAATIRQISYQGGTALGTYRRDLVFADAPLATRCARSTSEISHVARPSFARSLFSF